MNRRSLCSALTLTLLVLSGCAGAPECDRGGCALVASNVDGLAAVGDTVYWSEVPQGPGAEARSQYTEADWRQAHPEPQVSALCDAPGASAVPLGRLGAVARTSEGWLFTVPAQGLDPTSSARPLRAFDLGHGAPDAAQVGRAEVHPGFGFDDRREWALQGGRLAWLDHKGALWAGAVVRSAALLPVAQFPVAESDPGAVPPQDHGSRSFATDGANAFLADNNGWGISSTIWKAPLLGTPGQAQEVGSLQTFASTLNRIAFSGTWLLAWGEGRVLWLDPSTGGSAGTATFEGRSALKLRASVLAAQASGEEAWWIVAADASHQVPGRVFHAVRGGAPELLATGEVTRLALTSKWLYLVSGGQLLRMPR